MKIIHASLKTGGSVLVTLLLSVIIVGISIASYLGLVSSESRFTARSQAWNSAMPVLEAGIEDALTQLHYNSGNLAANSWHLSTNVYRKERKIGTSKYVVTISTSSPPV